MSHYKFTNTFCGQFFSVFKRTLLSFFIFISLCFLVLFLSYPTDEALECFSELKIRNAYITVAIFSIADFGLYCLTHYISFGGVLGCLAGIALSVAIMLCNETALSQIGTPEAAHFIAYFIAAYATLSGLNVFTALVEKKLE